MHCSAAEHLRQLYRAGVTDLQRIDAAIRTALPCEEVHKAANGEHELVAQQNIYKVLFEDPVTRTYPPPHKSRERLLKRLLAVLDGGRVSEVDDQLYAACINGFAGMKGNADSSRGDCFDGHRVLETPETGCIVVRVTSFMGGDVETGSVLWSAGCALFGLVAVGALDGLLSGHVLELGAGTGIVGLGVARRGMEVNRVTLTDGQPAVVGNLQHNVDATASLGALAVPLEARFLEWGSPELHKLSSEGVDVIIGSDLVYDPGCLPALASVLRLLLKPSGTASVAVLALTQRSQETVAKLFGAFENEGLRWNDLDISEEAWQASVGWVQLAHDFSPALPNPCLVRDFSDENIGNIRVLKVEAGAPTVIPA